MLAQAFQHESLIWRGLDHPHVLEFLGVDDNVFRHHLCMVLPWMELGNIRNAATHLREMASQTEMNRQILIWVCVVSNLLYWIATLFVCQIHEIAEGLAYLHSEGVIHGDLRGVRYRFWFRYSYVAFLTNLSNSPIYWSIQIGRSSSPTLACPSSPKGPAVIMDLQEAVMLVGLRPSRYTPNCLVWIPTGQRMQATCFRLDVFALRRETHESVTCLRTYFCSTTCYYSCVHRRHRTLGPLIIR